MSAVILFTWTATIICIGLIISSGIMAYYTYQVFPEIGMVMNSQVVTLRYSVKDLTITLLSK